jgi:hypothetical protein
MHAISLPGGLWWLSRVLAYRDLKYQIEHEQAPADIVTDWPADEGWA